MAGDFVATVDEWCLEKGKGRLEAIFKQATQKTVSITQSRIPVDTGFARASIRASLQSMPPIDQSKTKPTGGSFSYDSGDITLTIAQAEIGMTIFVGYTAAYAGILEAGSSKQAPSGFVRLAALQWQQTVNEVVAEAKARVG